MEPHLLSLLAHDIRNLATPMVMLLQVLRYKPDAVAVGRELDLIQQQVDQLILLTDNLRSLRELTSGEMRINNKHTPLREAMAAAAAKAGPWLAVEGLHLETPMPDAELSVAIEEAVLVLILTNLMVQAAPAAPGGRSVLLEVRPEPDQVALHLGRRGANSQSLGWWVTLQLVERHGGQVEQGEGLVVRLPR